MLTTKDTDKMASRKETTTKQGVGRVKQESKKFAKHQQINTFKAGNLISGISNLGEFLATK